MIHTIPPPLFRAEDGPCVMTLHRANIVTFGDFAVWKTVPAEPVEERSVEKDQPDIAEVGKMVDTEPESCSAGVERVSFNSEEQQDDASSAPKTNDGEAPLWCRTESRAVLQRANTVTLGDYLDPTYMDPALWKNMPMHLVELILSKVPFRDLVTMRRVCKYWNALILSEGFSPPFVPALIMFARTPTVRKMMWERNQSVLPEAKNPHSRWSIFRLWNCARRMFKRKPSRPHGRGNVHIL
ncbi:unnamed protein product [Calypogeia fissa]